MPRIGGAQRNAQRIHVTKLTDEHDIRILPQRLAQRLLEARRIRADFDLRDQRFLGRVKIFDRVFDGDDLGLMGRC